MNTLSEQILEPLVQEVVRRVLDEFNKRADLVPNVHERLTNVVYDLAELTRRIDKVECMGMDYKIERALEDYDFSEYGFLTEPDLIEFLNDRVRVTVE